MSKCSRGPLCACLRIRVEDHLEARQSLQEVQHVVVGPEAPEAAALPYPQWRPQLSPRLCPVLHLTTTHHPQPHEAMGTPYHVRIWYTAEPRAAW